MEGRLDTGDDFIGRVDLAGITAVATEAGVVNSMVRWFTFRRLSWPRMGV